MVLNSDLWVSYILCLCFRLVVMVVQVSGSFLMCMLLISLCSVLISFLFLMKLLLEKVQLSRCSMLILVSVVIQLWYMLSLFIVQMLLISVFIEVLVIVIMLKLVVLIFLIMLMCVRFLVLLVLSVSVMVGWLLWVGCLGVVWMLCLLDGVLRWVMGLCRW